VADPLCVDQSVLTDSQPDNSFCSLNGCDESVLTHEYILLGRIAVLRT